MWWAEGFSWPKSPTSHWTAAVCLSGVEECDYYLGIYPSRYGSDPLGIAFTEMEYHHAASRLMPRFLYQLYDRVAQPVDQRIRQSGFLNLLRDPDVAPAPLHRVESCAALLRSVERDLRTLPIETPAKGTEIGGALHKWWGHHTTSRCGSSRAL